MFCDFRSVVYQWLDVLWRKNNDCENAILPMVAKVDFFCHKLQEAILSSAQRMIDGSSFNLECHAGNAIYIFWLSMTSNDIGHDDCARNSNGAVSNVWSAKIKLIDSSDSLWIPFSLVTNDSVMIVLN